MSTLSPALNAYMRTATQQPFSWILDNISNSVASFGLRRLNSQYNGPLIRIRNASTNAEFDIPFKQSNGDLDTAAITAAIGSASAFVSRWYDQSGSGFNATQTDTTKQPRIVNAGTLDTQNGKPAIRFLGSAGGLATPNIVAAFDNGFTVAVVADVVNSTTFTALVTKTGTAQASPWDFFSSGTSGASSFLVGNNSGQNLQPYNAYNFKQPLSVFMYGSDKQSSSYFYQGIYDSSRVLTAYGDTQGKSIVIGSRNDGATTLDGYVSEVIVYGRMLNDQSRRFVSKSQMSYFQSVPTKTLVIAGDERAAGLGASSVNYGSWPVQLKTSVNNSILHIQNDSVTGNRFTNTGTPANGAEQRFSVDGASGTGIKLDSRTDNNGADLVIQLGSNDIAAGQDVATTYGQLKSFLANREANSTVVNYARVYIATLVPRTSQALTNTLFSLNDCIRYGINGTLAQTGTLTTSQIQAIATNGELTNATNGANGIIDFAALSQFSSNTAYSNATYYDANAMYLTEAAYALLAAAAKTVLGYT